MRIWPALIFAHGYGRINAFQALTYGSVTVSDVAENDRLFISPNPASGYVSLELDSRATVLVITDMAGTTVHRQRIHQPGHTLQISLDQLAPGLHIVHAIDRDGRQIQTGKLIVDPK